MGKKPRQHSPRKQHHVYNRGIDKKHIFDSIPAKYFFKKCISSILSKTDISLYAYAIMSNHMHFLIEGDLQEIGKFMQYIQGRYAYTFNLHHDREGRVFQNVYKSKPVYDDNYFWGLVRYIHMNPVKAGQCSHPDAYTFSSYQEYIHSRDSQPSLLSPAAISLYQQRFSNSNEFYTFHNASDIILYDDIREEVSIQLQALQEHALETIRLYYPISDWKDISFCVHHLSDIITLLNDTYHFTAPHISKLLGISPYHIKNLLISSTSAPSKTIYHP